MSWFKTYLLGFLLFLAACGFEPALSPSSPGASFLNNLEVPVQESREDFEFRAELLKQIGDPSAEAQFRLEYDLNISESIVTISSDADLDRYTLVGIVTYRLIDIEDQRVVDQDVVRASSGYSATSDTFPTRIAERDARTRLVQSLASRLYQVLLLEADTILK
ncbi:MAG: LPS assembly lipoprotein LptE [Pseudomonadota bacterium]